jgi:murein DD-endopeptidase MepM/ murein hydrolase activator NlpD
LAKDQSTRRPQGSRWDQKKLPKPAKNLRLLVIIAALVAVNAAVIAYHGDPRAPKATPAPVQRRTLPPGAPAAEHSALPTAPRAAGPGPREGYAAATAQSAAQTYQASGTAPVQGYPAVEESAVHASPSTAASAITASPSTGPVAEQINPDCGPPLPEDGRFALHPQQTVQRMARIALRPRQTPAAALAALAVHRGDIQASLVSLGEWLDFRRMRPGDTLKAQFDAQDNMVELEVSRGPLVQARTTRRATGWEGERPEIALDTVLAEVSGEVRSSLWDALVGAGEDARLVATLVDIFAYDIDFYTEIRPADSFSLLVEKRYINGQFVEYGDVTAAEFISGATVHRAFLHRRLDGTAAYYDAAGGSMRKQLLKAPLKYALVTSRFGVRRHPVLGYTRNHNGTDYGVPVGTPVWAVGDGRVVKAGWHGGFGRLVEVVHPNGWVSQYAHLSRIAVAPGAHVTQKQIVGLVGQSGLATGPHLHYGLKHNGRYVNSLAQHFERSQPLRGPELQAYAHKVGKLLEDLNKLRVAQESTEPGPKKG